jgi:hypothetical protein
MVVGYKHFAPPERASFVRHWLQTFRSSRSGRYLFAVGYKHFAPLERAVFSGICYKHIAPLERPPFVRRWLQTFRSSGAGDIFRHVLQNISLLRSGRYFWEPLQTFRPPPEQAIQLVFPAGII